MTAKESVKILLVDDQPSRLLTYEAILAPLGHKLVSAGSGAEALQKLMQRRFAVILLDVSMPDMDGFETARLIHQHPRFESTPIIFVTGVHVGELDHLKGYELGAVDYVNVPVVPEILRSKVRVLVELHCQRLELQRLNESLGQANRELDEANRRLKRETATELEELNRSLAGANRELAAANEALTQEVIERRRAEQALKEADQRKDEFLAILGHELRNPLAPIRCAIEILKRRGPTDPELARMRDMIDRQARHMSHLVDDLLDVSRITRGKINLKLETVDLADIAHRAAEANQPVIDERRQRLTLDLPPEAVRVHGDPVRLAQVIGNLLNNACKYTPEGGQIALRVAAEGESAVVTVRDTGIGIDGDYLPHVFELFGQVRYPRPHGHDGLGIGLALVERLVVMHGGRVEARSEGAGRGSEFSVRLPVMPATTPEQQAVARTGEVLSGRRVLVVDDHADCRDGLAAVLMLDGNEVRTAADGSAALEVAASFEPDVVLLDIRMPVMDGYETARRLRAEPCGRGAVLVAVTGWGQEEHRQLSQFAGFDAHLTKPVDHVALAALVAPLVRDRIAAGSRAAEQVEVLEAAAAPAAG